MAGNRSADEENVETEGPRSGADAGSTDAFPKSARIAHFR